MKLNSNKFAFATAAAFAIMWVICSLLVVFLPSTSMYASGYMMHSDFSNMGWDMHFTGFFVGLFLWAFTSGVTAWFVAAIYNTQL